MAIVRRSRLRLPRALVLGQLLSCRALAQVPDEAQVLSYNCSFLQLRNKVG